MEYGFYCWTFYTNPNDYLAFTNANFGKPDKISAELPTLSDFIHAISAAMFSVVRGSSTTQHQEPSDNFCILFAHVQSPAKLSLLFCSECTDFWVGNLRGAASNRGTDRSDRTRGCWGGYCTADLLWFESWWSCLFLLIFNLCLYQQLVYFFQFFYHLVMF